MKSLTFLYREPTWIINRQVKKKKKREREVSVSAKVIKLGKTLANWGIGITMNDISSKYDQGTWTVRT
jgi:hypothetical protein